MKYWLIGIAFLGYLAYEKYRVYKNYKLSFDSVDWSNFSIPNPTLYLNVNITNNTTTSVFINDLTGNLFFDYKLIGVVENFKPTQINSGNTLIKIPIRLKFENIEDLGTLMWLGKNLLFDGVIKIDLINIPIQLDYNL